MGFLAVTPSQDFLSDRCHLYFTRSQNVLSLEARLYGHDGDFVVRA
jgi:hypothetical protein